MSKRKLDTMNRNRLLTSLSVAAHMGIDRREAQKRLDEANKSGIVEFVGLGDNQECLYRVRR